MKDTIIIENKKIKLKNPILLVGLPGVGNIGKIVARHMIKEFKAQRIATLYSPHFPYHVLMTKKGSVRMMTNKFYYLNTKTEQDIIMLTGDFQAITPEGQYDINERIVTFFKEKLGGSYIFTIGGYISNAGTIKEPRVFSNATDKKLMENLKNHGVIFGESKGYILGSAGMIVGFGKMHNIPSACIMGEAYVDYDASAAKAVMGVLSKQLKLKIKTEDLDDVIKKTISDINKMGDTMPQNLQLPPYDTSNSPSYIR